MMKSSNRLLAVADAGQTYACDGNVSEGNLILQFSEGCSRRIERGEEYVTRLRFVPQRGVSTATYDVVSRHCAHCALAFFPAITVHLEESWSDTTNVQ